MTVAVAERPPLDAAFGAVSGGKELSDPALDDRLPCSLDAPLVRREDEPDRPCGKRCQEGVVAPEKRTEVHQGRARDRIDEHCAVGWFHADREGIGQ